MDLPARLVEGHLIAGYGDRVCCSDDTVGEVTYRRLYDAMHRYAAMLRASGIGPGERALVVSDDSVTVVLAIMALWVNGCIPVPLSPMLTDAEIVFIARECSATLVYLGVSQRRRLALRAALDDLAFSTSEQAAYALTDEAAADRAGARSGEEVRGEHEVLLQYTSGSTGVPRGVRQSLRGLLAVIGGYGRSLPLSRDDVVMSTAKLSFGYGFGSSLLWTLAAGAQAVVRSGPADVHTLISALRLHRPTVLCSVPRMYALLSEYVRNPAELGSVRLGLSAGEYLPAELSDHFTMSFGTPLVDGFGATEVGHIVLLADEGPGLGARPVAGVTATVRDKYGRCVADGEAGRLHIVGPSVALGYLGHPEDDRRAFTDGGVYTGDVIRRTSDQRFVYLCRADDLLNLGGFKVAPAEIEAAIRTAEGVVGCAVVGKTDGHGLGQAVAYVVPDAGVVPDRVRRAVWAAIRGRLAVYKRPARVEVVGELPVTRTGKLARYKLRNRAGLP